MAQVGATVKSQMEDEYPLCAILDRLQSGGTLVIDKPCRVTPNIKEPLVPSTTSCTPGASCWRS